ncbi:hypothetical protein HMPREF0201_03568 [Cedecea davisae DSM 4568]|uniref:Uncharacterized protein n=1 Tax=Cedecea davisae DSM 4568 TaxID=566551 RepID=S3IRX1_9ENTR|nr:hypothetical protein HMPREF0201_03568 [Cedecea davisae DSM 4568]
MSAVTTKAKNAPKTRVPGKVVGVLLVRRVVKAAVAVRLVTMINLAAGAIVMNVTTEAIAVKRLPRGVRFPVRQEKKLRQRSTMTVPALKMSSIRK